MIVSLFSRNEPPRRLQTEGDRRHRRTPRLSALLPLAGERTARRFVDDLMDHCQSFATFPERGLRRDDLARGLRIVGYRRRASIAFLVQDQTITIMRVFYGGRDIRLDPA
jgi:toxin ParE1/3/4